MAYLSCGKSPLTLCLGCQSSRCAIEVSDGDVMHPRYPRIRILFQEAAQDLRVMVFLGYKLLQLTLIQKHLLSRGEQKVG